MDVCDAKSKGVSIFLILRAEIFPLVPDEARIAACTENLFDESYPVEKTDNITYSNSNS